MPISIRLPEDVEARLNKLAALTGRSKAYYVTKATCAHIDDLENLYLAERELEAVRTGKSEAVPLKEVMKRHGMEVSEDDFMHYEQIKHDTFLELAQTGKIENAAVEARVGGWAITVKFDQQQKELVAERSKKPRIFRRFETAVACLKDAGIEHFLVNAEEFGERTLARPRPRPDEARALKEVHQAALYDKEFRERVKESLSDSRPNLSNEEVTAQFAARRAAAKKKLGGVG